MDTSLPLLTNAAPARLVVEGGRQYRVAPAVSIVPGVLQGSKGALLYEDEQIANTAPAWVDIPLTVYHPSDPVSGRPMSAAEKGVWERQGVGRIREAAFNGRLKQQLWFDVERTRAADKRFGTDILGNLERGDPIELSTGLYTTNIERAGVHAPTGRPYTHIATDFVPDHLAILPGQTGACSLQDGCGVLVNRQLVVNGRTLSQVERRAKPASCTCPDWPSVMLRNGSTHYPDCPIHKSWQAAGGFQNKDKTVGPDGVWVANKSDDDADEEGCEDECDGGDFDDQEDCLDCLTGNCRSHPAENILTAWGRLTANCGGPGSGRPGPCPAAGAKAKTLASVIKGPAAKVAKIQAQVDQTRAKLKDLQAKLKAARADMAAVKASVVKKSAAPTKSAAAAKTTAAALLAHQGDWMRRAMSGKAPASKEMSDKVTETMGRSSPHKVARELGLVTKFKSAAAARAAVHDHIVNRVGTYMRAGA